MSRLRTFLSCSLLVLIANGACASDPPSLWDREPRGDTYHAEVGDQRFDVTRDQLELVAVPALGPIIVTPISGE